MQISINAISLIFRSCLCVFAVVFTPGSFASSLVVQGVSSDQRFPVTLLRKVLENGGEYSIDYLDDKRGKATSEAKLHNDLDGGLVDIMWTLTSKQHEDNFQAIYIPIYRGLLGYRIAIVAQNKAQMFADVTSLEQLKRYKAGQGLLWADSQILEDNQLPVVKELKYPNLFPMLDGGRFDYFPRGIPEPWAEVARESKYNLIVDSHLLIKYTAPFYFFVKKGNEVLASHLNSELEKMITSGEFAKMFFEHEEIKFGLQNAKLSQRNVIELKNPSLSEKTPINRPELWFDPQQVAF